MLGKYVTGSLVFRRYLHGPSGVPATFYRGGTSRGLFFRTADLVRYTSAQREAIICGAMGSPDPDGRQISGLGGGISSLSKCAIIGPPGVTQHIGGDAFAGTLPGADDVSASQDSGKGWDVVYRFGQVPINGTKIDWGSTCGNLVAAAASFAIDSGAIPQERLAEHASRHPTTGDNPYGYASTYPVRLFVACSGSIFTAGVPISKSGNKYVAAKRGDTVIAGVPGKYPGVQVAIPLAEPGEVFPSGQVANDVSVDLPSVPDKHKQQKIQVSLVDAGLAVSFVPAAELGLGPEDLSSPVSELEAPTRGLMESLENVRYEGGMLSEKTKKVFSPPEPKICIIAPAQAYMTSSGTLVRADEMDLLIRAVSVGVRCHLSIHFATDRHANAEHPSRCPGHYTLGSGRCCSYTRVCRMGSGRWGCRRSGTHCP